MAIKLNRRAKASVERRHAHDANEVTAKGGEAQWLGSACGLCYAQCSILAKVKDGVIVKIEGNPDSPIGSGRLCPKGVAGIMTHYDPNRVDTPLMRTNPEKGLGVDPKWKTISWEEANEIILGKLRAIQKDDPRKLVLLRTTTISTTREGRVWSKAFGTPNSWDAGGGVHCGNGAHLIGGLFHASWSIVPDFPRCSYAIYFGASKGHSAGHSSNSNAQLAADARARGMRIAVVDPMCNFSASKAAEWVPIRPGTDAALALGIANIILNELGTWDDDYLKYKTNGGYLIGDNGHYVRDSATGKPYVWDPVDGIARTYDDKELKDVALLGSYLINGIQSQPGFQLIKEHVRKYSPQVVEGITTVPANTVRRIATEFVDAATIGATIEIDGEKLPMRPASAIYFRGAQGHKNSVWNCLAIELLNQIVGSADVPGGTLGFNPAMTGFPGSGVPSYKPHEGLDGLLEVGLWAVPHLPYPARDPSIDTLTMDDVWPLTVGTGIMCSSDQEEIWDAFNVGYRPEMMINLGANPVLTVGNPETAIEAFKKIPFMVSFDLFITEFSDLCDIILPDTEYLERFDVAPQFPPLHDHPAGEGDWGWPIRQPVVPPEGERRDFQEVMLEWAYELGFGSEYHKVLNQRFMMREPWILAPNKRYSWQDICDHRLKSVFGEEHDLNWFREHGVIRWPKTVQEVYWRKFTTGRAPIYYEELKSVGEKQRTLFEKHNFAHRVDWSRWEPLPEWTPCTVDDGLHPEFDLTAFYYRDVLHTNSFTYENPWLNEVAERHPLSYTIAINATTAKKKGLKSGDQVALETIGGRRAVGRVALTDTIHPEAVGVGGCGGHFTKGQPIAEGKGVRFNELLEIDLEHMDPVNLNLDTCVRIKIFKETSQ